MKQETKGKKIIRFVLSIVLMLVFSASAFLAVFSFVLGDLVSEKRVMEVVEKIGYENLVRENVAASFESLCETSGVPQSLTKTYLEEEVVSDMILLPIRQMFSKETLTLDTDALQDAFAARVEAYATELRKSGELDVSDEDWESMKAGFPEMASYFVKEIRSSICLSGLFAPLGSAFSVVAKISPYLTGFGTAGALFCAVLLILIWKKRVLYSAYASFASSGILLLLPALIYRAENYVMRLGIKPIYLKRFLAGLAEHLMSQFLQIGIVFILIGAVCATSHILMCRKKDKKIDLETREESAV